MDDNKNINSHHEQLNIQAKNAAFKNFLREFHTSIFEHHYAKGEYEKITTSPIILQLFETYDKQQNDLPMELHDNARNSTAYFIVINPSPPDRDWET